MDLWRDDVVHFDDFEIGAFDRFQVVEVRAMRSRTSTHPT
jgi:hypothetical protein